MKNITKDWLEFAEKDLKCCQNIINDKQLTTIVLFHAQQTVEKCFKAILEESGIEVRRTHDLVKLFSLINDLINFEVDSESLIQLNKVYSDSRYPGDLGLLPDGLPSQNLAMSLLNFASDIFIKTKEYLIQI
jgi:HEPN domain-containing protein